MANKILRALTLTGALAGVAGGAAVADTLWLHVRVDEAHGAKVTVNLPLALVEKALPMIPNGRAHRLHFDHRDLGAEIADLRAIWRELRDSPDMTFVTVEEDDEKVRVWKQQGTVFVEVRERRGDGEVDVRLPVAVVDAFLAGEDYDFQAAVQALVDHGQGEFVDVRDDEDHVRVWVDRVAEAGE